MGSSKSGRAPGVFNISAELLKAGGVTLLQELAAVFRQILVNRVIPADWRQRIIIPTFKGQGDYGECGGHSSTSLLSEPDKVFARVVLDKIRPHLVVYQRPKQSGFTPKKSTVDHILALRVLKERRGEFLRTFYRAYVDFQKKFDSVHRVTLWELLRLRGIPREILELIRALYTSTESAVRWDGDTSDFVPVETGVRQGCVFAPSLFSDSVCMDRLMGRIVGSGFRGTSFGEKIFTDLNFCNDAVIFASRRTCSAW